MPLIDCENLIKIYKQGALEVIALEGLDFRMEDGEFVAMVGPSGSGKSSLLQILAGMDQPSAGRVVVADTDLSEMTPRRLVNYHRKNVGFLWQEFNRNLLPYLRAGKNVELPMLLAGVGRGTRRRRARALLEAVGLDQVPYARVHRLSGGEQQRLALCVALALGPRVLLADEPTGELDTESSLRVYELLRELSREEEMSVLVVTHDVALASQADRVVHLVDGRLATERYRDADRDILSIDRRGRIQVPREMVQRAGINERVEAEVVEDGLLLRRLDADGT